MEIMFKLTCFLGYTLYFDINKYFFLILKVLFLFLLLSLFQERNFNKISILTKKKTLLLLL
jgi:hypothetical protein